MNLELPDVQASFRKGRGTRDQIAKIHWIIEKAKKFQKNAWTRLKSLTVWITTNCGKFLKKRSTRPPYLSPKKRVCSSRSNRTGYGRTIRFQIGKRVQQGCILSPCLFHLYAYMQSVRLDESQTWIKIACKSINNLGYADDTTLKAESEERLSISWWRWKWRMKRLGLTQNSNN